MKVAISIFIVFLLLAQLNGQDAGREVFRVVEEMPRFPGCEEME